MKPVYKVLTHREWQSIQRDSRFSGSPDDVRDGFIHLSAAGQIPGTVARHFAQESAIFLLAVDPARLGDALRWETSRNGEVFPHLHGALGMDAVTRVWPLTREADGSFVFPADTA